MPSEQSVLLDVSNLEVVYSKIVMAVQGVSFKVPEGKIVAILGVNGAGKSTTLNAISGFLPTEDAEISDGIVEFDGKKLNGKLPHEIARQGLVLVPERVKIFETLTVKENLLASKLANDKGSEMLERALDFFPILRARYNWTAGYLSGGERQMLAVASGLVRCPKLLAIDELSLGLSPAVVDSLFETIRALNKELKIALLVVEQNAVAAFRIADYVYILENGRMVYKGTPDELRGHDDIREFYLGIVGTENKTYRDIKQYKRSRRWW